MCVTRMQPQITTIERDGEGKPRENGSISPVFSMSSASVVNFYLGTVDYSLVKSETLIAHKVPEIRMSPLRFTIFIMLLMALVGDNHSGALTFPETKRTKRCPPGYKQIRNVGCRKITDRKR